MWFVHNKSLLVISKSGIMRFELDRLGELNEPVVNYFDKITVKAESEQPNKIRSLS